MLGTMPRRCTSPREEGTLKPYGRSWTAAPGATGAAHRIEFTQDIEDMFYGARQFCIRDLNGYELYFIGDHPEAA